MTTAARNSAISVGLLAPWLLSCAVQADDYSPHDWLNRMASAVQSTNYEGTVVRVQNGKTEALKVVHKIADGVIHEKVVIQDGNGLEIIRSGNEVHCILPDSKSVIVEEWNDRSTFFSTLPSSDIRFGNEYDVGILRHERVAGRKAVLLAIRPHDDYRFGHRLWLDVETGFPLQTELFGIDGKAIEKVRFVDIKLDSEISARALMPSYSTESFRWITETRGKVTPVELPDWTNDSLPPGFQAVSTHEEELPGRSKHRVTHILFSDGLANVSVFIAPKTDAKISRRSRLGASNSISVEIADHYVTAVGEVPVMTLEAIAGSMRPR